MLSGMPPHLRHPDHPATSADSAVDHDVVIVGGRCAGAALAHLLAARGHDVAVVDRAPLPSDTLSTHAIARGGVVQLARWGLLEGLIASGAPPIRRVTFGSPDGVTTYPVKDRAGVDHLLAPRRTVLDAVLLDAARQAGATTHPGTLATGLVRSGSGRVVGVSLDPRSRAAGAPHVLRARHVVGADGVRSMVARETGADVHRLWDHDVALFYTYVDRVDWDGFELFVGPKAYAGVFPTHGGAACVWLSRPARLLRGVRSAGAGRANALVDALASASPDLARRVRSGRVLVPVRGWVAPPSFVRAAYGDGWSLVGDAGCFRDPITGHGITDAFRDAELLADALSLVLTGDAPEPLALARYERERDVAAGPVLDITERLTMFPEPARFAELQIELSKALDAEAQQLSSRPAPAGLSAAPAA
jgi:flavin-dependent dehydrogenase